MKFIILVSNLKEISPSVFSWKNRIYKKNYEYDAIILSNYDSAEKRYYIMLTCCKMEWVDITSFFNFNTKLAESSLLCRFLVESVNVFVLPRFDLCHVHIFFTNKQFRTCANAFPNEFTVMSYTYCAGTHLMFYWMQDNHTATYFLHSRLFTYDIMKICNCN
jgi:hypothetical protein